MCDQQSLRSACAYAQSDQSLCLSLEYSMSVKLLTEHNLECLSLIEDCTGSSESTHVKMPHYWKSHVTAQMLCTALLPNFYPGYIQFFSCEHVFGITVENSVCLDHMNSLKAN